MSALSTYVRQFSGWVNDHQTQFGNHQTITPQLDSFWNAMCEAERNPSASSAEEIRVIGKTLVYTIQGIFPLGGVSTKELEDFLKELPSE